MDNTDYAAVLITASSDSEAERIQQALLTEHRAACVTILPRVRSAYWWQGKLETAEEIMLIAKTRTSQIDEIVSLVKRSHSYTVPEIVVLPVVGGNADYLVWIDREVSASRGGNEKDVDSRGTTEV